MSSVQIDGKFYEVTESLGYVHGRGWAKAVSTLGGERIAVKEDYCGKWRWAEPALVIPRRPITGQ